MTNYLEKVKLKKDRKEYLETLIDKKVLIFYGKINSLPLKNLYFKDYALYLKQIVVKNIDDDCNVIGFSEHKEKFFISDWMFDKVFISNLEDLKNNLEMLFVKKESIDVARLIDDEVENLNILRCSDLINLDTLLHSKEDINSIKKLSLVNDVPLSKYDVCTEKTFLFCFDTKKQSISAEKLGVSAKGLIVGNSRVESIESFKNGFYYGTEDLINIVDDVSNHYKYHFIEENLFKKFLGRIFSF